MAVHKLYRVEQAEINGWTAVAQIQLPSSDGYRVHGATFGYINRKLKDYRPQIAFKGDAWRIVFQVVATSYIGAELSASSAIKVVLDALGLTFDAVSLRQQYPNDDLTDEN